MNAHQLIRSAALGLTVATLAAPTAGAVPAGTRVTEPPSGPEHGRDHAAARLSYP